MARDGRKVEAPITLQQTLIIEDQKVFVEHREMPLDAVILRDLFSALKDVAKAAGACNIGAVGSV